MSQTWTRHIGSDAGGLSRAESSLDEPPRLTGFFDNEDHDVFVPKAKQARTIDQAMEELVLRGWSALVRTSASNCDSRLRELLQPWAGVLLLWCFGASSSSHSVLDRPTIAVPMFVSEPPAAVHRQVLGAVSTGDPRSRVVLIKEAWEAVA